MRNSILDSGPDRAPTNVEIRVLKAALESASGPAEASIQVAFKGSLVVHVVLLPVEVLSLVGLLPSSLITLSLIIAWGGMLGRGVSQGGPRRHSQAWCRCACKEEGLRAIQAVLGKA